MTVYTGLYYSYIEQEKYKQAEQLLNDVDRLILHINIAKPKE